jgi:hypothetical protein
MMNAATPLSAHDYVSNNPVNTRYTVGDTPEAFEKRVRLQYEQEDVSVDESCYPVLVFANAEVGNFAWFDCERQEGYCAKS